MRLLLCFLHVLHLTKSRGGGTEVEVNEIASAVETALEYNKMQASISPSGSSAKSLSPDDTVNDLYLRFMQIEGIEEKYWKHFFGDQATPGPGTSQESEEDFVSDESKHPELGKVTLSLQGTEITENGTSMDLVGMKFELDGNVLSLTERNFSLTNTASGDITVSADIFYKDTREYKDGDWVSFSSEMTITTSGTEPTFTYELSNLKYKGETMSQADTDRVEKILMGEDPGTVDPGEDDENPASKEELLEFTSSLLSLLGGDETSQPDAFSGDISRDFSVSIDMEANADAKMPKMKTNSPIAIELKFSAPEYQPSLVFNGSLDVYSVEEPPKKMLTISFNDFGISYVGGSFVADDNIEFDWEEGYSGNESNYTRDDVAPVCVNIALAVLSGNTPEGVTVPGNITDIFNGAFSDLTVDSQTTISGVTLQAVKVFDSADSYVDGSELSIAVEDDYTLSASMQSGSELSLQTAEISGSDATVSFDEISEELRKEIMDVYTKYADALGTMLENMPDV